MAQELRRQYHEELRDLEVTVQKMGVAAQDLFETSIRAVEAGDAPLCDFVVERDDEIDKYYLQIERHVLDLFALQTPVASDLRLLTVILHTNLHLERIGDMAVNIAKIAKLADALPRDATVVQHIEEMGAIAIKMVASAMEAFDQRDVELCYALPKMDDPIDRLNRGMLNQILEMSKDKGLLEWGIRMHVISRQIERVGDHAVDIGEQIAFLVTGEFREFTDASHPEMTSPSPP